MGGPCFHKPPLIKAASEGKGQPEVSGLTDAWGWMVFLWEGEVVIKWVFISVEYECLKDIQVEIPSKPLDINEE